MRNRPHVQKEKNYLFTEIKKKRKVKARGWKWVDLCKENDREKKECLKLKYI